MALSIDAGLGVDAGPLDVELAAVDAESRGYDGIDTSETSHDPVVGLSVAARATTSLELITGVMIAFARNPMTIAVQAADLQSVSNGRFRLGLGSQIKPHIERRFSMTWSHPAPRMREFIDAMHAIWNTFDTGEPLQFDGRFYQHTLMTPAFNPGPLQFGRPDVWLAGVGAEMTKVAGAVAQGFMAHPFTTASYLAEVSLPTVARGAESAGRAPDSVKIRLAPLVAVGRDQAELDVGIRAVRKRIAFYGSTPAYRKVLEHHGWEDLAERLNAGSRRREWDEMERLVTDDVLAEFTAIGTPSEVAEQLRNRFYGRMDRLTFSTPYAVPPELSGDLLSAVRRSFAPADTDCHPRALRNTATAATAEAATGGPR